MMRVFPSSARELIVATFWAMDKFRIIGGTLFNGAPPLHLKPDSTALEGWLEDGSGRIVIRLHDAQAPFTGRPLVFQVWEADATEPAFDFAVTVPAHVLVPHGGGPGDDGGQRAAA